MASQDPNSLASSKPAPALSFSHDTFAKLAPGPFLLAHLSPTDPSKPSIRPCGRRSDETRPLTVHTGSLGHADGSAVVRMGDTAAVCGVRAETLRTTDVPGFHLGDYGSQRPLGQDLVQDLGLLVPNVELATGCSPQHLPGGPPTAQAQSLAMRLLTLLYSSKVVDPEALQIWHQPAPRPDIDDVTKEVEQEVEVKGFWTLYIDVLFIALDGNAFDVAWAAMMAALSTTVLPKPRWDEDLESIVCNSDISKASHIRLMGCPVACTYTVYSVPASDDSSAKIIGTYNSTKERMMWVLADPDAFEEDICREKVTIVVDSQVGRNEESNTPSILRIEKQGGIYLEKTKINLVVNHSLRRWHELHNIIQSLSKG